MSKNIEEKPTTGWFVVSWIVPLFAVMFVVNGIFVWFAVSTHTGNQTENAYDEGLHYNLILEEAQAQERLGWRVNVAVEQNIIIFSVFDREGYAVEYTDIEVLLFSPMSAERDQVLAAQNIGLGHFSVGYTEQMKGQWQLRLKISNDGEHAEFRRKVVLP